MTTDDKSAPLDRACLLVGRFLLHFSKIEAELNEAIRKLFELNPDSADTLCANIDFSKKINIVKSALIDQSTDGSQIENIKKLFGRIAGINEDRLIAAHASFESNGTDGVKFSRPIAKTGLVRRSPIWTESYCTDLFETMDDLRSELHILAQTIAPYHPSLDFSDPRNSMYLAVL